MTRARDRLSLGVVGADARHEILKYVTLAQDSLRMKLPDGHEVPSSKKCDDADDHVTRDDPLTLY